MEQTMLYAAFALFFFVFGFLVGHVIWPPKNLVKTKTEKEIGPEEESGRNHLKAIRRKITGEIENVLHQGQRENKEWGRSLIVSVTAVGPGDEMSSIVVIDNRNPMKISWVLRVTTECDFETSTVKVEVSKPYQGSLRTSDPNHPDLAVVRSQLRTIVRLWGPESNLL